MRYHYLPIILIILLAGCPDNDDTAPDNQDQNTPPADTTHLIEGFINGAYWFSDSLHFTSFQDDRLALKFHKEGHEITIVLQQPGIGLFPIDTIRGFDPLTGFVGNGITVTICKPGTQSFGSRLQDQNGFVEVSKYDTIEKKISGTFETIISRIDTFLCAPPLPLIDYDTIVFDTTLKYTDFIFTDVPF